MTEDSKHIKLSNISLHSWLLIMIVLGLILFLFKLSLDPFYAERHYRDGFNLNQAKQHSFAIQELKQAVKFAPLETQYLQELGKAYEGYAQQQITPSSKIKYFKKAVTAYEKCIVLDDQNPWHQNRAAFAYTRLLELDPKNSSTYQEKINYYIERASQIDQKNPLFQLNYAYHLHSQNKIKDAAFYYLKTIEIDGDMLEARYNIADILRRQNQLQLALNQYIEIFNRKKDFNNVGLAIAALYMQLNKAKEAIPYLKESLDTSPNRKEILVNLANIYHQSNQFSDALTYFEILFSEFPDSSSEYFQFYTQSLVNLGQYKKALNVLKPFLKNKKTKDLANFQQQKILNYIKTQK